MSANTVKIFLSHAKRIDHLTRKAAHYSNRKARRMGFKDYEHLHAVCDSNPQVANIVREVWANSGCNAPPRDNKPSRRAYFRSFKHSVLAVGKSLVYKMYRLYREKVGKLSR